MILFDFAVDLNRKMRTDLFVKNHIEILDSQLTLAFSKAIKQNQNDENDRNEEEENQKTPTTAREKNDTKSSSHQKGSNKDRHKNSILIPKMRNCINYLVPLLPNGSELQRRMKSIVLTNTCAFDSLVSVYAALYIDNQIMRDKIDNSTSKFAQFIKLLFQQRNIDSKIEFARYEFLEEIFADGKAIKEVKNLVSINCHAPIGGLFRSMCTNNADILASRQRMEKCSACSYEDTSESPFVNYSMKDFDFKNVQSSIVPEKTRVCGACMKKTVVIDDQFYELVVIDCELASEKNEVTSIKEIQSQINLKGIEYELLATIEFDSELKHFIPHIKRESNDWETYDDLSRMKTNTDVNGEMLIFMLFYKKKSNGKCLFSLKHLYNFSIFHVLLVFNEFATELYKAPQPLFTAKKKPLPRKKRSPKKKKSPKQNKQNGENESKFKPCQSQIGTESEEEDEEAQLEEAWKNKNRSANSQSILEPTQRKLRPRRKN